jgi:general secretion pathway protein E
MDLGLPDYLIASVLRGAMAQRLVRALCPACKEPIATPAELVERLGLAPLASGGGPIRLYGPRGCSACGGTGYRGRSAVLQLMNFSPALREAVLRRADSGTLHALAEAEGMASLREAAHRKALAGITSLEEVLRVVGG